MWRACMVVVGMNQDDDVAASNCIVTWVIIGHICLN